MADHAEVLTVSEMRRRRRALEALDGQVKDLVDALVVSTQSTVQGLAAQLAAAEQEAADALAVAVRVYGSSDVVAGLTGIPTSDIDRTIKGRSAAAVDGLTALQQQAAAKVQAAAEKRAARRHGSTVPAETSSSNALESSDSGTVAANVPHQPTPVGSTV
ncbi:hypothetical protein ACFXKW_21070 [Streptomyces sp. NPDC059193]|uniref:hypothetical protein n=1 Tax=Streptomyces sp. NPDC059193 TaxID=3346763 RepID=UPI0036782116